MDIIQNQREVLNKIESSKPIKRSPAKKSFQVPEIVLSEINLNEIATHVGICDLASSLISDVFRYDHITEYYYYYDGTWNQQEDSDILFSFLTNIGRQLMALSEDYPDVATKKMVRESGAKMLNNSTRESISKMLITENYLSGDFDQKIHLIGCSNGIFNTKNYLLRSNSNSLFVSKKINANYDPKAKCPVFDKFMSQLFEEDVREYVQRIFGSCLAGRPNKVLPIFYGDADNGKTCLLEIMQSVFGDYATVVMPDVLFSGSGTSTSNRQTQIVGMKGYRLCTISETSESHVVNSSSLKKLTGGDTIVDRSLYAKKVISFKPTHTLFMGTNALPYMKADPALETRIRFIHMKNSFVLHPDPTNNTQFPVDLNIKNKILKERDGIFQWLIEGCKNFDKSGLFVPETIKETNKKVKEDNDLIQQFINEGKVQPIDYPDEIRYLIKPFHEAFQIWYREYTQQNPWGKATIAKQMKDKGFKTKSSNGQYFYWKKGINGVF